MSPCPCLCITPIHHYISVCACHCVVLQSYIWLQMCIAYIKALPHCANVCSVYVGTVSLPSYPLSIICSVLSLSQALRSLYFALFCVYPFSLALYILSRALPLLPRCLHLALFCLPPFSLALYTWLYSVSLPSPSLSILRSILSLFLLPRPQ